MLRAARVAAQMAKGKHRTEGTTTTPYMMPRLSEIPPAGGGDLEAMNALGRGYAGAAPGTTKSITVPWEMLMIVRGALG